MSESSEYEKFVTSITQALLDAQGLETVKAQHNLQVQGISRSHQVDVYWEYRLGGVLHRVIVNCKHYARTVAVTDVLTLSGVLQDLPGVRGLIVTTVGFQSGAIDYATTHQIGLKIIRPPTDLDYQGRIREVHINFELGIPSLLSCQFEIDALWLKEQGLAQEDVATSRVDDAHTTVVRDLEVGVSENLEQLWNRAMNENPTDIGSERQGTLRWENAMLERDGQPALRIRSITFGWKVSRGPVQEMVIRRDPAAIVMDAIDGTLLFVDPDGRIHGDVRAEFGTSA